MSQAEVLPESHSAELHLEGGASYAGQVSELLDHGLLISGVHRTSAESAVEALKIPVGARATLAFSNVYNEDGTPLDVAVSINSVHGRSISLEMRSNDEVYVAHVRQLLLPAGAVKSGSDSSANLEAFKERALRQADSLIDPFIMDAADRMMDLASQHGNRDRQDALFEAMNILRRDHQEMREIFSKQITEFFDDPLRPKKDSDDDLESVDVEDLGLVDIQDFEDSLTIDRIVREAQRKLGLPMEALTIRFADMCDTEPMDTRLPVHVAQLCSAFREAVIGGGVNTVVVSDLYKFFDNEIVKKLAPYYKSLNTFLKDRGVQPDIDEDLEKNGSLFERLQKERAKSAPRPKPAPAPQPDLPSEAETAELQADAQNAGLASAPAPGGAPGSTAAAGTAPAGTAPAGGAPVDGGASADAALAGGAQPATAGVGSLPQEGVHQGGVPQGGAVQGGAVQGGAVQGGAAHGGGPQGGVPQGGIPQGGVPVGGAAQGGAAMPGGVPSAVPASDGGLAAPPMAPTGGAASRHFDAPTLYRSVIDALNFRRAAPVESGGTLAGSAGTGTGSGGPPATSGALANVLSQLQSNEQVRSELREQRSVRQYLADRQADMPGLEGTDGFETDSINQLDLVDNLFSDISVEVDVEPELRPIVGDLQIPLAKLALLEPQFFADQSHPARGVIDKVTQLANSSNYPNRALETKVSGIIDNIVQNYQTDSQVFANALEELDSLSAQQKKALERNVERVVKTQDGQEKLRKAEKAVDKVLRTRIRPPQAPRPLVDLVDKGWRDLLKLTFVKQGPNSRAWKDYVKTLDLLSLWLMQKKQGEGEDEQVQVERALEAEPLLDMVSQQISEALPTHMEHEPVLENLREVLAGRAELEYVEVEPPEDAEERDPEKVREKVQTLPRLRRWVQRVEDLERGAWLTYRDKQGAKRRMQLAWINEDGDRFIFVNERGQKVADVSGVELARQLSKGVKPPTPSEELPLVDQSMYKTLEHVQRSLSFEKNHDSLTRLINRDTFMDQIEQALQHAKAKHANHALLYIDIDKFGLVNQVYDETTGDQILVEFGKLLAQQHDRKVSSARLEGDRFAVLLLDRTLEQSIAHAEGIRGDIESSPVDVNGEKISFTVSIGVAAILDHTESVSAVLDRAQLVSGQAKKEGGNRVVQFNEDKARADAYKSEEAEAIKQIEHTLDTKNFVLQAQPIARAELVDGQLEVEHYEILMAIADENGKLSSPQDFIKSAEQFGYMVQVDQWVVRQVFSWISQMMDEEKDVPNLAINLSGNSVTDDAFMEFLFEAISEYGVGTSKICFEITETGTINNMVKATDFVNEFKNIGCKFSIDDFGTGLASHSYLRDLPVDYVKIDGTFIKHIHENPKDFAMAKSINDLSHFLGMETIAEFAENDEVIAKLREIGCDYIQGWGVGRPAPLTSLTDKLEMMEK